MSGLNRKHVFSSADTHDWHSHGHIIFLSGILPSRRPGASPSYSRDDRYLIPSRNLRDLLPAKTNALFNEQITVQSGVPDHRRTCFELVHGRKRRHRYCRGKYDESRNNIYRGGDTSGQVRWREPSFTSRQKGEECVFEEEPDWEHQEPFEWTITVQEVVTGGETTDALQTFTVWHPAAHKPPQYISCFSCLKGSGLFKETFSSV